MSNRTELRKQQSCLNWAKEKKGTAVHRSKSSVQKKCYLFWSLKEKMEEKWTDSGSSVKFSQSVMFQGDLPCFDVGPPTFLQVKTPPGHLRAFAASLFPANALHIFSSRTWQLTHAAKSTNTCLNDHGITGQRTR